MKNKWLIGLCMLMLVSSIVMAEAPSVKPARNPDNVNDRLDKLIEKLGNAVDAIDDVGPRTAPPEAEEKPEEELTPEEKAIRDAQKAAEKAAEVAKEATRKADEEEEGGMGTTGYIILAGLAAFVIVIMGMKGKSMGAAVKGWTKRRFGGKSRKEAVEKFEKAIRKGDQLNLQMERVAGEIRDLEVTKQELVKKNWGYASAIRFVIKLVIKGNIGTLQIKPLLTGSEEVKPLAIKLSDQSVQGVKIVKDNVLKKIELKSNIEDLKTTNQSLITKTNELTRANEETRKLYKVEFIEKFDDKSLDTEVEGTSVRYDAVKEFIDEDDNQDLLAGEPEFAYLQTTEQQFDVHFNTFITNFQGFERDHIETVKSAFEEFKGLLENQNSAIINPQEKWYNEFEGEAKKSKPPPDLKKMHHASQEIEKFSGQLFNAFKDQEKPKVDELKLKLEAKEGVLRRLHEEFTNLKTNFKEIAEKYIALKKLAEKIRKREEIKREIVNIPRMDTNVPNLRFYRIDGHDNLFDLVKEARTEGVPAAKLHELLRPEVTWKIIIYKHFCWRIDSVEETADAYKIVLSRLKFSWQETVGTVRDEILTTDNPKDKLDSKIDEIKGELSLECKEDGRDSDKYHLIWDRDEKYTDRETTYQIKIGARSLVPLARGDHKVEVTRDRRTPNGILVSENDEVKLAIPYKLDTDQKIFDEVFKIGEVTFTKHEITVRNPKVNEYGDVMLEWHDEHPADVAEYHIVIEKRGTDDEYTEIKRLTKPRDVTKIEEKEMDFKDVGLNLGDEFRIKVHDQKYPQNPKRSSEWIEFTRDRRLNIPDEIYEIELHKPELIEETGELVIKWTDHRNEHKRANKYVVKADAIELCKTDQSKIKINAYTGTVEAEGETHPDIAHLAGRYNIKVTDESDKPGRVSKEEDIIIQQEKMVGVLGYHNTDGNVKRVLLDSEFQVKLEVSRNGKEILLHAVLGTVKDKPKIYYEDNKYYIDAEKGQKIFYDDKELDKKTELRDGDEIQIGGYPFIFSFVRKTRIDSKPGFVENFPTEGITLKVVGSTTRPSPDEMLEGYKGGTP